jgi:hypothetical protein
MKRRLPILLGSALALVLWAADARAAFIPWSYNWSPGSAFVSATTGGGRIDTSNEVLGHAQGSTDTVITNLKTESTAPRGFPDVYTNAPFTASLTIVDGVNGLSGSTSFSGVFNGKISSGSSDVGFALTSPRSETIVLGNDIYTVTFLRYSPPGPPSAQNTGSMSAHIQITHPGAHAPEPSSALLACLGGSFLGLFSWRKWTQRRRKGTLCGAA